MVIEGAGWLVAGDGEVRGPRIRNTRTGELAKRCMPLTKTERSCKVVGPTGASKLTVNRPSRIPAWPRVDQSVPERLTRRTLAPRGERMTLPLIRTRDPLRAIGEAAREIVGPRFA